MAAASMRPSPLLASTLASPTPAQKGCRIFCVLVLMAIIQSSFLILYEFGYFGPRLLGGADVVAASLQDNGHRNDRHDRWSIRNIRRRDRIRRVDDDNEGAELSSSKTKGEVEDKPRSPKFGGDEASFEFEFPPLPNPPPDWVSEFLSRGSRHSNSTQYLVMICYRGGDNCGGTTDRLKLLAYYAYLAHKTHRVLLIRWTKPCPLEEFLVPRPDGYDWRVPLDEHGRSVIQNEEEEYLSQPTQKRKEITWARWHERLFQDEYQHQRVVFANSNKVVGSCVKWLYEELGQDDSEAISHLFQAFFQPTPPLLQQIRSTVRAYGLVPGQYAAAHLRARYPRTTIQLVAKNKLHQEKAGNDAVDKPGGLDFHDASMKKMVSGWAVNAINCAVELYPETNIVYFASDSNDTVAYIMEESIFSSSHSSSTNKIEKKLAVAAMDYSMEPLHLDYEKHVDVRQPSDFYSGYIDLWLLSHAKCVTHGMGGYGEFVAKLTGNYNTCRKKHRQGRFTKMNICKPAVDGAIVEEFIPEKKKDDEEENEKKIGETSNKEVDSTNDTQENEMKKIS